MNNPEYGTAARQTNAANVAIDEIVDVVLEALVHQQQVDIESYCARYPELAAELREIFPSLVALADLGDPETDRREMAVDGDVEDSEPLRQAGALGDFRLIKEIGRGGMGVVYEAEQISLHRPVALKVLPLASLLDKRQLARFKNEARAAALLTHPHIVRVYQVGCERGIHYYAMELIQGQTLAAVIRRDRRCDDLPASEQNPSSDAASVASVNMAPQRPHVNDSTVPIAALSTARPASELDRIRQVAELGIQAAEALDHAHQVGVIHRDVKPSNLLLDDDGKLWVTDFGLAATTADTGLTVSGDLLGTLRYMSPEQAQGKNATLDGRTDIYSLGVTLYELLTRVPAVPGEDRAQIIQHVVETDAIAPRKLDPAIPRDLETILLKAIAKEPDERYGTMRELSDDLRRFLQLEPIQARRPRFIYRCSKWIQRHQFVFLAVIAAILLFAVITSVAWYREVRLRQSAEENLANALNVIVDTVAPVTQRLQFQLDPTFANTQIIDKAIASLEEFSSHSNDPRIARGLVHLYTLHARFDFRSGKDSIKNASTAVGLARRSLEVTGHDEQVERLLGRAYDALAKSEFGRGHLVGACAAASQAIRLNRAEPHREAGDLSHYGLFLHYAGSARDAAFYTRAAVDVMRQDEALTAPSDQSLMVRDYRLGTLMEIGAWGEADELVRDILAVLENLPAVEFHGQNFRNYWTAETYAALARLYNCQGATQAAIDNAHRAAEIYREQWDEFPGAVWSGRRLADCHLQLSDAFVRLDDLELARHEVLTAIEVWQSLGHEYDLNQIALARFRLAQILVEAGEQDAARSELQAALDRNRANYRQLPDDFYHVRRLLMLLTLSPISELRDTGLALELASQTGQPDSPVLARYRALAFSMAGQHERAQDCIQDASVYRHSRDAVDLLIEAIVLGQAGEFEGARQRYDAALASLEHGEPVNTLDTGPLAIPYLRQQAERLMSRAGYCLPNQGT